jgi:hypothetical protein
MPPRQRYTYLILLIAFVTLPTAAALVWYQISRDPNLRPLGVTKQALRAYGGEGEGVEITAVVDWGSPRTGGYTQEQLAQSLTQSFAAKGVDVVIRFRDGQSATQVTYVIGKTVLGPYPTARAAAGVAAAVDAFRMY